MKIKTIEILMIIITIINISCEKETSWKFKRGNLETIVVNSIITNEYKKQLVKISMPSGVINDKDLPVSGAYVTVSANDSVFVFTESDTLLGYYYSRTPFVAIVGTEYRLNIVYKDSTYTAKASLEPVEPFTFLSYSLANDSSGMYKIDWVNQDYNQKEQAMYRVDIDWSNLVDSTIKDTVTKKLMYFYSFKTVDVSEAFAPQTEKIYFPKGSIITETKYSLSDDYAAYLRALQAETAWRGGVFDEQKGNLPSNISPNGLGFFSVCAVIKKTVEVK